MRGRLLPYLVLAAAATAVLLPGIGSRDLWNPDEPRYAEVAREMLLEPRAIEHFLVPRLNGERYDHKPPLHFWNIALFGALRGGVETRWRPVCRRCSRASARCSSSSRSRAGCSTGRPPGWRRRSS